MRIVNDAIYGPIQLSPANWVFIDTPAFQRLRNISQLGMTSWVYPTACHKRFEHSVGTAHLAGKLVKQIKESQPDLGIADKYITIAELAGLLHDIGHGPFSHCWDVDILPALNIDFPHEKMSLAIIDWLLEQNEGALRQKLKDSFGLDERDIELVKEMIHGERTVLSKKDEKYFLYDIISNSYCGLDVDKLDYLIRDGAALGTAGLHKGDLDRLIRTAIVTKVGKGGYHLVWRDVTAPSIRNVFLLRHTLHSIAYQHKTTVCVQLMFLDAMKKAEKMEQKFCEVYKKGEKGELVPNIEKFLQLSDSIFWDVLFSDDEELKECRKILEDISSRHLYSSVSSIRLGGDEITVKEQEITERLNEIIDEDDEIKDEALKDECKRSFIVKKCLFTLGCKENPLELLRYKDHEGNSIESKENRYKAFIFDVKNTVEADIRLYSRSRDETGGSRRDTKCNKALKRCFKKWAEKNSFNVPFDF